MQAIKPLLVISLLLCSVLSCMITRRSGYPTPEAPRAALISKNHLPSNCTLLGIFEEKGRDPEEAKDHLLVRIHEAGGSHVVFDSGRPINRNVPPSVDLMNNSYRYKRSEKSTVVTGKGYSCKRI